MKKLMISFLLTISIGFVLSGCGKPEKESKLKVDNVKEVQNRRYPVRRYRS